jgi:hypothetical protein
VNDKGNRDFFLIDRVNVAYTRVDMLYRVPDWGKRVRFGEISTSSTAKPITVAKGDAYRSPID